MQPFQPIYNLNYESFFPSPHPNSQYAQSPQPFVLGEGDIASVINPNGAYSFFFVPTMKPWLTITFNPNMPSYIHPYWYTDSGVWIIRSISNPIPWNLFLQMIQRYSNNIGEFSNYPTSQLPLRSSSQQNMDTQPVQFHNDCVTSTTDLHYFFPRPHISVNTLRMNCDCNKTEEEMGSQFLAANKMDVLPQYAIQKMNGFQESALQFSLPQQVVCNRPCFCVPPPNSNNQNPMKAFSFRQPYQNGATEYETETHTKENLNTLRSCKCERPYLPCLCHLGLSSRKSKSRKTHSMKSSSDSSNDGLSINITKKCNKCLNSTESVNSVQKNKHRSKSQHSLQNRAEEQRNENRKHRKNYPSNSNSLYQSKNDQKNKEYVTYSNSSVCDEESCPYKENKERGCNNQTCPARKRSTETNGNIESKRSIESGCTNETCPGRNKKNKQSKSLSCTKETCPAHKKKRKSSTCTDRTCPAHQEKNNEFIPPAPLKFVSSCDNESCPAKTKSIKSISSCTNESCPALNKHKKESFNDPERGNKTESEESITSWNVEIDKSNSKGSLYSCNNDTCPAHRKKITSRDDLSSGKEELTVKKPHRIEITPCAELYPKDEKPHKEELEPTCNEIKEELGPTCDEMCCKEETAPIYVEIYPKEEIMPTSEEVCPKEEIMPTCQQCCTSDSNICSMKTCRACKQAIQKASNYSQSKEEYRDTVNSSSSKSDCDIEYYMSRKHGKDNNQSQTSVLCAHSKELLNSCGNCSTCNLPSVKKSPFSWRSKSDRSKSKKSQDPNCCCSKCTNDAKSTKTCKSCSIQSSYHNKKSKKDHKTQMQQISDDNIRTTGKKYKPRICCNMGARFLIGKRRREDTNDCSCGSNSPKQDTFFCTGCRLKETSTNARTPTLDKHITTYKDNSTNCATANATQTKICKCYPRCHKKDRHERRNKKNYTAELWEPKINCEYNCHQFLLDLRGSVPCLYGKNME